MKGLLLDTQENWQCSACGQQHVTKGAKATQVPLHQCRTHAGAWVPFVRDGVTAHVRVHEREDYIGTETPTTDANGRIIRSVVTERDDGEDCHIFATTVNYDWRQQ